MWIMISGGATLSLVAEHDVLACSIVFTKCAPVLNDKITHVKAKLDTSPSVQHLKISVNKNKSFN
jgi:histidinol dehydrogenase